jgi:hypothetical protein
MHPMTYLDPTHWFPSDRFPIKPKLHDVLVLLPSYRGPQPRTRALLENLSACGATIIPSYHCSDVALHRNLVAGRALQVLEQTTGIRFVFWLDDDMVGTVSHVEFLRATSASLKAAVTGIYCKRTDPSVLTIKQQAREVPRRACIDTVHEKIEFDCHGVLAGMGCLMVRREEFLAHSEAVPAFDNVIAGRKMGVPALCCSGVCPDERGKIGWVSEDQCYCQGLWQWGSGVWTAPIVFGHMSDIALTPHVNANWLPNHESSEPITEPATAMPEALDETGQ